VVFTADNNTLEVVVERNGQVERTMPTSMGKSDTPTDNGVYIIADRHEQIVMDSSTYGVPVNSPQGYKTPVNWATRMSYSGIFLHSAPWSIGAQGSYNSSHGCLNLSPDNAMWVFNNTKPGDIVVVKNTNGGRCPAQMGWGTGTSRGRPGGPGTRTSRKRRQLGKGHGMQCRGPSRRGG